MTEDERTGSCIICALRDPLPELEPVCGSCRTWLQNMLWEIPGLCAELAGLGYVQRDPRPRGWSLWGGRIPGALLWDPRPADPVAHLLPAGPIPGAGDQPRVSGSRERSTPAAWDLLAPARAGSLHVAQDEDQVGVHSVATELDFWVQDWRAGYYPTDVLPGPTVVELSTWLARRVPEMCGQYPAIDEVAFVVRRIVGALRSATGRTVKPSRSALPCPSCDLLTVYRDDDRRQERVCHNPDCNRVWSAEQWDALISAEADLREGEAA